LKLVEQTRKTFRKAAVFFPLASSFVDLLFRPPVLLNIFGPESDRKLNIWERGEKG
jgi:hypothetical protein